RDLRDVPLIDRKNALRGIVPRPTKRSNTPERLLYLDHVEREGTLLFEKCLELDLEGIVAERKWSRYVCGERTSHWMKMKNPVYTQAEGRAERFERASFAPSR